MIYLALAAYNEEQNIGDLLQKVVGLQSQLSTPIRVIITNDGSNDQTLRRIREFDNKLSMHVIDQPNKGFLKALDASQRQCLLESKSPDDVCVTMDADDTHPVPLISQMLAQIEKGKDIVIASRFAGEGKMIGVVWYRELLSMGARVVMTIMLLGHPRGVRDFSTAYRMYRIELLRKVYGHYSEPMQGRGFSGIAAFLIRCSYLTNKIAEVPLILRYDQKKSVSKLRIWPSIRGYLDLIGGYWLGSYRPNNIQQ